MKFLNYSVYLLAITFLYSFNSKAQNQKLQKANDYFESKTYPMAVRTYEDLLQSKNLSNLEEKEVLINLGYTYKKLQDYLNAKRIYKQLFSQYDKELDPKENLNYAQVLAGNGNYRGAQKYFSRYGEYQKNDLRGGRFAIAYMDNAHFYQDSSLYKIRYMEKMNSKYADFSPMYYENGLVFVSARKDRTVIRRVFGQDETPFLDLFLYPDSSLTFIPKENDSEDSYYDNLAMDVPDVKNAFPPSTKDEIDVVEFSKKLNSKYHEGPVTFSKDFRTIIFTRNNYINGKTKKSNEGFNMLKLYMAQRTGNKWANIEELPINSNNFSNGHPAFSPENNRLYFVSDMPGGYGGTDIYSADYINGEWGNPVNLGPEVNTEGNEMFPFIDQYGNMYFASDGLPGMGGLDIFYVELRNGMPVGEPENLGAPINSQKDDFGLITDGQRETGYFSSNRKKGYSDDNIYSFVRGCNELKLKIFDEETLKPIADAEVRLVKNDVNREFFSSDSNGLVQVCLNPGKDFYFKVFSDNYQVATVTYGTLSSSFTSKQTISVYLKRDEIPLVRGRVISELDHSAIVGAQVTLQNEDDESTEVVITGLDGRYAFQPTKRGYYIVKAVKENSIAINKKAVSGTDNEMEMLAVDDYIRLDNINYNYGKYNLDQAGKKELDEKVIPMLKKYTEVKIELSSHTDSRSSAEFNLELSQKRAEEVKKYLVEHGINENRIIAVGYGKSRLLNECDDNTKCTAAQHRENRRTEIKILNFSDLAVN